MCIQSPTITTSQSSQRHTYYCPTIFSQTGTIIVRHTVWQQQLAAVRGRKWQRREDFWVWPSLWLSLLIWVLWSEWYHLPHYRLEDDSYIPIWHFQPQLVRTTSRQKHYWPRLIIVDDKFNMSQISELSKTITAFLVDSYICANTKETNSKVPNFYYLGWKMFTSKLY